MSVLRKEQIGDAVLYLGDCRDVIASFPACFRVDHVITDPPFEAEAHTLQRRSLGRGSEDGRRDIIASALPFEAMNDEARAEVSRKVVERCSGWALVFCQAEGVSAWRDSLEAAGAKYRRAMVWVKPDGMPQFTGDRPGMGYESIVAAWCGQGTSKWNGGGRHGVFTIPKHDAGNGHGGTPNLHPTTKPSRLMSELVLLFTSYGDTILDPFMGSASTGVAALKRGRKFVGIELNETYFDHACQRIEEAWKQPRLFEEPAPKPKQLDLIGGANAD